MPSENKSTQPGIMTTNSYGKSRVRLTKIVREGDIHNIKELTIDIQIQGEFDRAFLSGDNSQIVATDSMKNTVYVLAAKNEFESIEEFGSILAEHFIRTYKHVSGVTIEIEEDLWQRVVLDGKAHPHAFFGAGGEKRWCQVATDRTRATVSSGIRDLRVVKTTASEFWGFIRDEYTTLPEVRDRIFGATIASTWVFDKADHDFNLCYEKIRSAIIEVFATHHSLSVQQTLYEAAQRALDRCNTVKSISLIMPNQHRVPFNLEPFKLENTNQIFITTDEPYGLISATISRK
jgi:urate oxidase